MIKELYAYACPKLPEQKNPFNLLGVICITLFSSLSLIFGDMVLGAVITIVYLGLSLLCYLDKDPNSQYLKLVTLGILDISAIFIYLFSVFYQSITWIFISLGIGCIFAFIYEVVFVIKIKKGNYSSPANNKKLTYGVSVTTILLCSFVFRILRKIPAFQNLVSVLLLLLSGAILLGAVISAQKLIIYVFTKNKVRNACDNLNTTNENY